MKTSIVSRFRQFVSRHSITPAHARDRSVKWLALLVLHLICGIVQADDHGGTLTTATVVGAQARTVAGVLETDTDQDWFKITVAQAGQVRFYTTGTTDTTATLYDNNGSALYSTGSGGAGSNFKISLLRGAGTYYLRVMADSLGSTGAYTLGIIRPENADQLTPTGLNDSISVAGEVKLYRFAVGVTGQFRVFTTGSTDTQGTIYDNNGYAVYSTGSGGAGNNFEYSSRLSAGDYFLIVEGDSSGITGSYTLELRTAESAFGLSAGSSAWSIGTVGDEDFFTFESAASGTLTLSSTGSTDTEVVLYDSEGFAEYSTGLGGAGGNFSFSRTISAGRYYFVVKGGSPGVTGAYGLSLSSSGGIIPYSTNANLAALTINSGILTPAFTPQTTSFTTTVPDATTSIFVTPIPEQATSSVSVNGVVLARGARSSPIALATGANTITIVVTAQSGISKTHTLQVTRLAYAGGGVIEHGGTLGTATVVNAQARSIRGVLDTDTDQDWFRITVAQTGEVRLFTTGTTDTHASLYDGSGGILYSTGSGGAGSNSSISGRRAAGTYYLKIISDAPGKTGAYTLNILRPENADDIGDTGLDDHLVEAGEARYYRFNIGTTGQARVFTTGSTDTYLTLYDNNGFALYNTGSGGEATNFGYSQRMSAGTYYAIVLCDSSAHTGSYHLHLRRPESAFSAPGGTSGWWLNPAGDKDYFTFQATSTGTLSLSTTGWTDTEVTLYDTDGNALYSTGFGGSLNNFAMTRAISAGRYYFTIGGGSPGVTGAYNLVLSYPGSGGATPNANLSSLVPGSGVLSPSFSSSTTSYAVSVPNTTTSIALTPTAEQASSTIRVNGTSVASGTPSSATSLNVGSNTISILVTAQDGTTTKTYTVVVTRAAAVSYSADLASLVPNTSALTPSFSSNTTSYAMSVPNTTASMAFAPVVAQTGATVAVSGLSVASGNMSPPISLSVGANVIVIVVTAGDGVTIRNYIVTVTRAAAPVVTSKAEITSPPNGSTLTSTSLTLAWSAGSGVSQYVLWVGTTPSGYDLYAANEGANRSRTVGVPAGGGRVHVTLWSLINGVYSANNYVFTTMAAAKAELVAPANGSTLVNGTLSLNWTAGAGVSAYVVWIGSAPGGYDLGAANAGTALSRSFTVPQDGGPVYVTLWSLINGAYQSNSYWFVTALPVSGARPARVVSPANTTSLTTSTLNLTWDHGVGATSYALWVGSKPDGYDLFAGFIGTATSKSITVPGDGRLIYVTLHSLIGGAYQSNSYFFTAPTLPDRGAAQIIQPANGATLSGTSLPLVWEAAPGATQYALWVGSAPMGYDVYAGNEGLNLNKTVTVPADGSPVYCTLWSLIRGTYLPSSTWFTTANTVSGSKRAKITFPANGSTLTGAQTTITWDAGSGVTTCALWLGSSPGSYDLLAASVSKNNSRTVTLPTDGSKIYATLHSLIGGTYRSNTWIFTAAAAGSPKAEMTSPANTSTLGGSTVTFTWNSSSAATSYALWVGRQPGGYDLYAGAEGTRTSKTLTTLPADGSPVYVTLYTLVNGAWQSNEYIYQAANQ